jgi:Protein of unknown function (DUF4019)
LSWLAAIVALAIILFIAIPSRANGTSIGDSAEGKARAAILADEWLKSIDDGNYYESWNSASPEFKKGFTSKEWARVCQVDSAWGTCQSRRLATSNYFTKIRQSSGEIAPGEWVVVRFESTYAKLGNRAQTVVVSRDPDGQWRTSGYVMCPD